MSLIEKGECRDLRLAQRLELQELFLTAATFVPSPPELLPHSSSIAELLSLSIATLVLHLFIMYLKAAFKPMTDISG